MAELHLKIVETIDNYNLITPHPMKPGYGLIYQGMNPEEWLREVPGPLFVIQMNRECSVRGLVDQNQVVGLLSVAIADNDSSSLSDTAYIAAIEAACAYLQRGCNLYIHCAMGMSRSSYLTLGILMREQDIDLETAIRLLKRQRPIASPNSGFLAHLRRLETRLRDRERYRERRASTTSARRIEQSEETEAVANIDGNWAYWGRIGEDVRITLEQAT